MASLQEEFQTRFKTLPEDIRNALTAVASVDTIFAIGKKHGLMVDQIGKMADEIWKVMLGLANPKDFIRNLASSLGIESMHASAIANDVNAQMFQLIRESLRRLYDATEQEGVSAISAKKEQAVGSMYKVGGKDEKELKKHDTSYMLHDTKQQVPPMIFPQNKFEEEFRKEPVEELPVIPPAQTLLPAPPIPPSPPAQFTYPEKTREVSREPATGGYKGRDPYREGIE